MVTVAVPALAMPESPPELRLNGELAEPAASLPLSSPESREELKRAGQEAARQREEFEARLAAPDAVAEREGSQNAFEDLAPGQARAMAQEEFGEQLAGPPVEPGELAHGGEIDGFLDDFTMRVVDEQNGRRFLVSAPVPLRAKDDSGDRRPVELALEQEADGSFEPEAAPAEVSLPAEIEDGIEVEETTVYPEAPAAGAQEASQLGDQSLFYADTARDTDVVVTALPTAIETFHLLRSAEAPTVQRLNLDLPAGAELHASGGGAEVVKGGERIGRVLPPSALDAQGRDIPVSLDVDGSTIELRPQFASDDVAFPVLVDPTYIVEDYTGDGSSDLWMNGGNLAGLADWQDITYQPATNPPFSATRSCRSEVTPCYSGRTGQDGLHVYTQRDRWYGALNYGEWYYDPPGASSQVVGAILYPTYYRTRSAAVNPAWFSGIYSESSGNWVDSANLTTDQSGYWQGHFPGAFSGPSFLALGLFSWETAYLPQWRDGYIGGAYLMLSDPDAPTLPQPTVSGPVNQWTRDATYSVSATASDNGLGVHSFGMATNNGLFFRTHGCTGARSNPCPSTWSPGSGGTPALTFTAADQDPETPGAQPMPDGKTVVQLSASDPLGHVSPARGWWQKIDRSGPQITAGGELPPLDGQTVSGPYTISASATDGQSVSDVTKHRSGVERLEVKVDGQPLVGGVPSIQECPDTTGNCELSGQWTFNSSMYTSGWHDVSVVAADAVGNRSAKRFRVLVSSAGELLAPTDGETTARRLTLSARAHTTQLSRARFEYRRSQFDSWSPIPEAHVQDAAGAPIGLWPRPLSNQETGRLSWDAAATMASLPGGEPEGPLQVRAVFSENGGSDQGTTKPADATLDIDGLAAATARASIGPGQIDLLSGNFSYSASDVAIQSFAQNLTINRTFNSRDPNAEPDPMFGPGWTSSLPVEGTSSDYSRIVERPDAEEGPLVELVSGDGSQIVFYLDGTTYVPEEGFEAYRLTKTGGEFRLADIDGSTTVFAAQPGSTAYSPTQVIQPGSHGTTTFGREGLPFGRSRVTQITAPIPEAVTGCAAATPGAGCRVLKLIYASTKSAHLSNDVWGDYPGRLKAVEFWATDPADGVMKKDIVARWAYDGSGRLRAAWDPRISPALKEEYSYDSAGRLATIKPPGQETWTLNYSTATGPANAGRLQSVERPALPGTAKTTVVYGAHLVGSRAPYPMGATEVGRWGQTDVPTDATAIFPPGQAPPSTSPDELVSANYSGAVIHYLDHEARQVNLVAPGGHTATTEYDDRDNVVRELSPGNRARALLAPGGSAETAAAARSLSTEREYEDYLLPSSSYRPGNKLRLVLERGPLHSVRLADNGQVRDARRRTEYLYQGNPDPPAGQAPYLLPTTATVGAEVPGESGLRDARTTETTYDYAVRQPTRTTVDPGNGGPAIVSRASYTAEGLPLKKIMPNDATPDGTTAGTVRTTYYSADTLVYGDGPGGEGSLCFGKPAWAGLPCVVWHHDSDPDPNLPELPHTVFQYNRLGQVTKKEEKVGATTLRTSSMTYDSAGRQVTDSVTASQSQAIPTATTTYNTTNGLPESVSIPTGPNRSRQLNTAYDGLGRPTSYKEQTVDNSTATTLNTATRTYDLRGRLLTTSDGKGTQTRTYDDVTGLLVGLDDSAIPGAQDFTASHDADGQLTSKTLPNGLQVDTAYDPSGAPVGLKYEKKSPSCSSNCPIWFEFQAQESIHGQWLRHTSTGTPSQTQNYAYDKAGRLTQVEDITAAGQCRTRRYGFDLNSNRTSLNSYAPGAGGACQTVAADVTKTYDYDDADRLRGGGIAYDNLGRITSLPAQHSGGGILTSTYYVNDLVHSQSQDGTTNTYALDPMRRQLTRTQTGQSSLTETYHYADDSDSPAWTTTSPDPNPSNYTRYIEGIDGDLAAIQTAGGATPGVMLQLSNLHGDVFAEVSTDPTAPKPTQIYETDEFGNPKTGSTGGRRFGWLGGKQRRSDLNSGVIQMGVRSYVPALGRFLQVDPLRGGSANAYDYADCDPANRVDLDGLKPRWRGRVARAKCRTSYGDLVEMRVDYATRGKNLTRIDSVTFRLTAKKGSSVGKKNNFNFTYYNTRTARIVTVKSGDNIRLGIWYIRDVNRRTIRGAVLEAEGIFDVGKLPDAKCSLSVALDTD